MFVSLVAQLVKKLPANARDARDIGLIPGWGRSPGAGNGNPLQYSCLGKFTDREAWQATVHGVTKSWMPLNPNSLIFPHPICPPPLQCWSPHPVPSPRILPKSPISGSWPSHPLSCSSFIPLRLQLPPSLPHPSPGTGSHSQRWENALHQEAPRNIHLS